MGESTLISQSINTITMQSFDSLYEFENIPDDEFDIMAEDEIQQVGPKLNEVFHEGKLETKVGINESKLKANVSVDKSNDKTQNISFNTEDGKFPAKGVACNICSKYFNKVEGLRRHQNIHQPVRAKYQCKFCDKSYSTSSNVATHTVVHTGEKKYQCTFCELNFFRSDSLSRHEKIHTNEKPYSCNECGKT